MKIVIDTNVLISGTFFGGKPGDIIRAIDRGALRAFATPEIINEYEDIVAEMISRGQGHLRRELWLRFYSHLELIEPRTEVQICRDPDDDKFIGCALDAGALYIVSGDKDLLDIGRYEGVEIINAADFCKRYLD